MLEMSKNCYLERRNRLSRVPSPAPIRLSLHKLCHKALALPFKPITAKIEKKGCSKIWGRKLCGHGGVGLYESGAVADWNDFCKTQRKS